MRKSLAVLFTAMVVFLMSFALPVLAASRVQITGVMLSKDEFCLPVGGSVTLYAKVIPLNAVNRRVVWHSTNEAILTVDNGVVTAVSYGTAEIVATSEENSSASASARITVVKPVESITLEESSIVLPPGFSWEMIAYVLPEDATFKHLAWSTTDRHVATVDEKGVVTAAGVGSCKIIAASTDDSGVKAAVSVRVKAHEIVISEPGEFDVDFEMTEDEGVDEIVKGAKTIKDSWQKLVKFETNCVEKVSDTSLRPLKSGSDVVHCIEMHNKKTTRDEKHTIYVTKDAVRETGSVPESGEDSEILFRDIPWDAPYKQVRSLLSKRGNKLKSLAVRNNMIWTQIDGKVTFGHFTAFRNGLSFVSDSANVDNLTANLQKTRFAMGDYYFDKSIPFENLKQNVMNVYNLPENETTGSGTECVWRVGEVTVHLFAKAKYTQLQISHIN